MSKYLNFLSFQHKIESQKNCNGKISTAVEFRNIFQSLSAWEQWSNFLPCSKPQKTERKVKLTLLRRAFVKKLFVQKGKGTIPSVILANLKKLTNINTHSHGHMDKSSEL